MAANYFTCTLGQASSLGLTNPNFRNINSFLDSQARSIPDQPAVGFAKPTSDGQWDRTVYTFSSLRRGVLNTASLLHLNYGSALAKSKTVGLICPSTPDFLLTWLALIRLGYSVLLIAPQCTPAAIAALCAQTSTSLLFHDDVYASLAHEATAAAKTEGRDVEAAPLPFALGEPGLASILASEPPEHVPQVEVEAGDVAYLHHTSGTSSGIPKPIPQTHRGAAGVLPAFSGPQHAMFTTTPMYHGGPADCFRAWTSGAMIWLFPGKDIPITAANVIKCLDTAGRYAKEEMGPEVKYFASVPYVLQMMEADPRGLTYLEEMDIVGVGGAALPQEVGDRLVKKGVNLISRFGSAECGFLMSSHRDYRKFKEWQFLRSDKGVESLSFEKQDDGLAELVVSSGWPHMAKTNQEDGSFATADLFAPHPSIPNAWRYHSRADSQLTLITGKKFDPAPLEGIISASEVLDDVLIFGDGQPFPGALLFRSETAREIGDEELVEQVWPTIAKLNSESQDHARIPKRMLVPMQVLDKSLEKSSKGSLLRGAAESRFRDTIDAAYTNTTAVKGDVPDERVLQALKDMIATIVPPRKGEPEDDTDLFSYGVDSVAGMQIRHGLRQLLPQESNKLPLNVVEDCGTIARLADYIVKQRHGLDVTNEDDELAMMERLVEEYSDFRCKPLPKLQDGESVHVKGSGGDDAPAADDDVVLLTGATGALGAHLLDSYRQQESVSKIYCLVRGADQKTAKERINKALEQRSLSPLSNGDGKVVVLRADLGDPYLGLNKGDYTLLAREISIVMHVAWSVNFRMRLRSFVKDNIAGVRNLIDLCLSTPRPRPPYFGYCSSVASVATFAGSTIPEEIIDEPKAASPLGYSRSKWVAERICQNAADRTSLRGRIAVFRVGQLSGDSRFGIWNTKEAWPMMLSAVKITKSLPALQDEPLDWLPVDVAAAALMQGIASARRCGDDIYVLHVLNAHRAPNWMDLLGWLQKGQDFAILRPKEWVESLEMHAQKGEEGDHPALKLLQHWKMAFGDDAVERRKEEAPRKTFDLGKTRLACPVLRDVTPVTEDYFFRIWDWLEKSM